ncbi:hypothetical protein, variant [Capsaspora owczarzaki ATCC 30864]|uniref:PKD domain-containing protein n=1 Tax=Capsaspora owczarzaki (strain ATCC 30864) TaxID=595528 RepID=A0A0D2U3C3_CAPO3|nr:hypothetical protein, variant [Capsaspora owczarzaki ATCC 30864]
MGLVFPPLFWKSFSNCVSHCPDHTGTTQTVSVTNVPANMLLTYSWTFGDGTHTGIINNTKVDKVYAVPNSVAAGTDASYTIRVFIENTLKGGSNPTFQVSTEMKVRVLNTNPVISNILSYVRDGSTLVPYNGQVAVGTNFQFQAEAYDVSGTNLQYSWLFGDCTKGAAGKSEVYHQFHFPGVFTITLQVTDPYGGYSISSTQVTIDCSPQITNGTDDFLNNGNCHLYGKCTKISAGNFTCLCETGFMGDGFTCQRTFNPCLPGYAGYRDCVVNQGNLECIPETLSAGMYTGGYQCSTCRPGFYRASGECRKIDNPCASFESEASVTCRQADGGRGLTCIPEIITIGDGVHEALFTGKASCGDTCPPGFVAITDAGNSQLYCQVVINPCSTGNYGADNCTGLGYTTCVPAVTPDSAGSLFPLYTGAYTCGNDAQCQPGYTLTPNRLACVLIPNPCRVPSAGYSACAAQNRECFPAFTLDGSGNTLYLGDNKYSCGGCGTGYIETTIYDPVLQRNRQACAKRPNPCDSGQAGSLDCSTTRLCLPVAVPNTNLYSGQYVCVTPDTLSCPEGYETSRDESTNHLVCVPTAASNSAATSRNIGIAVGLALLALIVVIILFVIWRRKRSTQAKISYNYAQKQEFELMTRRMKQGVGNPMADVEGAAFDNPLADHHSAGTFNNPLNPMSAASVDASAGQHVYNNSTLSAATALSIAATKRTTTARPSTVVMREDVDLSRLTDKELMQIENPLYMTEEESDFSNPLARSATLTAKKRRPDGAGPSSGGIISASDLMAKGGNVQAFSSHGDNPLSHASDDGDFSNPLRAGR